MQINVSDILAGDIGSRKSFAINNESPDFGDITLTVPLSGQVMIGRIDDGVAVRGSLATAIELDCHRCLTTFEHPITLELASEFSTKPGLEQWPIGTSGLIDLASPIREEILLHVPMKQLCAEDCAGIKQVN